MSIDVQVTTKKVFFAVNDHPIASLDHADFKELATQIREAEANLLGFQPVDVTIDLVRTGDYVLGREIEVIYYDQDLVTLIMGNNVLITMPKYEVISIEQQIK